MASVLVAYGRELERSGAAQVGSSFSGNPAADELLERDPNAFLLGLLFTQGIPAERAWAGPWLLSQRMGSLDLELLATQPDRVRAAFQEPPMLHRFKETLPRWVTSAARRLLDEYGGDASRIWRGGDVIRVVELLSEFDGVGRKKAVMAAEILVRHFGAPLTGREQGQVAYDVQVRRVFLRSGLAEEDSPRAIEAAAAEFSPAAPGVLDLPAWLIGREVCRPTSPRCSDCPLAAECERRTWLNPTGVGAKNERAAHSADLNTMPDRSLG